MRLSPALSDTVIEAGVGHEDTLETSLPPCIAWTFLDFFRGDHCGGGLAGVVRAYFGDPFTASGHGVGHTRGSFGCALVGFLEFRLGQMVYGRGARSVRRRPRSRAHQHLPIA